ncbi:MAG TPA: NUDIX hydrolase [Gammaproteobacteria bacterium]|nr:NUDIX hydrolase [Gammaproteobacteria bacterium]
MGTSQPRWTPHTTVAAIIEQDGRFLLVEERDAGKQVFNQPAGHLEAGESLIAAVHREVWEETGLKFTPQFLIGIYRWQRDTVSPCYLRFLFGGMVETDPDARPHDDAIIASHWLRRDDLLSLPLRSPLVLRGIDDYLVGRRYDLALLQEPAAET